MEKIDFVKFLIGEIEDEQAKFLRYEKEKERAAKEASKTGKCPWECFEWEVTVPKKSRIIDNCKMARRMLLDIEREEKPC